MIPSWKSTYGPVMPIGTSEQIQQLLAKMRVTLEPSMKECGPARRNTDLTDDRQLD